MSDRLEHMARTALVVCTLFLGLQLWCPLALQAAELPGAIGEMGSVPVGIDGTDEGSDIDLALVPMEYAVGSVLLSSTRVALKSAENDRGGLCLLPVTGLHPSAP
jgi:hypothetical protein